MVNGPTFVEHQGQLALDLFGSSIRGMEVFDAAQTSCGGWEAERSRQEGIPQEASKRSLGSSSKHISNGHEDIINKYRKAVIGIPQSTGGMHPTTMIIISIWDILIVNNIVILVMFI